MCNLHVTHFVCNCPDRDTPRCPHHVHVRTRADVPGPVWCMKALPTGFFPRWPGDLQRKAEWEPLEGSQTWAHCDPFKATYGVVGGPDGTNNSAGTIRILQGPGLEMLCPSTKARWDDGTCVKVTQVKGLCAQCEHVHQSETDQKDIALDLESEWADLVAWSKTAASDPSDGQCGECPDDGFVTVHGHGQSDDMAEHRDKGIMSRICRLIPGKYGAKGEGEEADDGFVMVYPPSAVASC